MVQSSEMRAGSVETIGRFGTGHGDKRLHLLRRRRGTGQPRGNRGVQAGGRDVSCECSGLFEQTRRWGKGLGVNCAKHPSGSLRKLNPDPILTAFCFKDSWK